MPSWRLQIHYLWESAQHTSWRNWKISEFLQLSVDYTLSKWQRSGPSPGSLTPEAELLGTLLHSHYSPVCFSSHKPQLTFLWIAIWFFPLSGLWICVIGFLWTFAPKTIFEVHLFFKFMMLSDSCDLKMPPKKPNPPSLLVCYWTKILIGSCFLGLPWQSIIK